MNVYKTFNHEMSHYQKPIQVGWQARTYVEEILSRDLWRNGFFIKNIYDSIEALSVL